MDEKDIKTHILDLINQLDPDVIILTGHDSYNKKGIKELGNYRNTIDYVEAVKQIRKCYSKDHFSKYVYSNYDKIDFSNFIPLLDNIRDAIKDYNHI